MKRSILLILITCLLAACNSQPSTTTADTPVVNPEEVEGYLLQDDVKNINEHLDYTASELKTIYFAGGCFWGVEAYFARIYGVADTVSGYANGTGENPSYEEVIQGDKAFVETVKVTYDPERVSLDELIEHLFSVIDPTSENKQGNDVGIQYRSGIYYDEAMDATTVEEAIKKEQQQYDKPIVTEAEPLQNFYLAEAYHQDYLVKNPNGYCHINLQTLDTLPINPIAKDEMIVQKLSK